MKQKPNLLVFNEASRSPKRRRREATGQPHHGVAWPAHGPRPLWVRPPWSTPDTAPLPIKTPRREKPKDPINFPETHCDPPPSSTRDREGPKALPGTLPERGITTGGLLHRHACLRSDEWVVYLGLGCACETPLAEVFFFPDNGARKLAVGAYMMWENVVDVGASSSSIPGNGASKLDWCGTVSM
jgi:hypothetical protein